MIGVVIAVVAVSTAVWMFKHGNNKWSLFRDTGTLKSLLWNLGPWLAMVPSMKLRTRESFPTGWTKPICDPITVYFEMLSIMLLLVYLLRQMDPDHVYLPAHFKFDGSSESSNNDNEEIDKLMSHTEDGSNVNSPALDNKTEKRSKKSRKFLTLPERLRLCWYQSMLCLVSVGYVLMVAGDYMYQQVGMTVVNSDALNMGKDIAAGGNAGGQLLGLSEPTAILSPIVCMLLTGYATIKWAGDYAGSSVVRWLSRKGGPGRMSCVCLLMAFVLVCNTGSWSPIANFVVAFYQASAANRVTVEEILLHMVGSPEPRHAKTRHIHTQALLKHKEDLAKQNKRPPNIIFMVSDSLSSIALNSPAARANMPFFRTQLDAPEVFGHGTFCHFQHSRATSALTVMAMSAVLSGIMPLDKESGLAVTEAQVGKRFQQAGYDTAVFSPVKIRSKAWAPLVPNKSYGYDLVTDIDSLHEPVVICCTAMDDRILVDRALDWLNMDNKTTTAVDGAGAGGNDNHTETDTNKPFMMLLLTNHLHPNYILPKGVDIHFSKRQERYMSSLNLHDSFIKRIFESLAQTGELQNTIIFAASDHGEVPGTGRGEMGARQRGGVPVLLNNDMWAYVGKDVNLHSSVDLEALRINARHRVASSYDAVPTLMHLAGVPPDKLWTKDEESRYVTGVSLAEDPLPPDRHVMAWQGAPWFHQPPHGAVFRGVEEAFFFGSREEIVGLVKFPEEDDGEPFPELPIVPLEEVEDGKQLRKVYQIIIRDETPKMFLKNVEPYVASLWEA